MWDPALSRPRRTRIERVSLRSAKLPAGSPGLRIVVISDVHLGDLVGPRRLGSMLDQVRSLNPDVLLSAGDLIDGQADHLEKPARMLAEYRPTGGKYAVTGNHEYFVGLDQALDFHGKAGFHMLQGQCVEIGAAVTLAGVDDPTGRRLGMAACTDEAALLKDCSRQRFTILLKHRPRIDERVLERVDLQISGHVHKGQIFPFGLIVRLFYPLGTGLRKSRGGGWLYVSRGTGTWGPPMRIGAPAEITLIELAPAGGAVRRPVRRTLRASR